MSEPDQMPENMAKEVRSTLVSRNITVLGRRTSVRLEPEMWSSLRDIAKREQCKTHDICSLIQLRKNPDTSLTAAIRVFIMLYYRASSTEDGHRRAGHGDFNNMMHRARMTTEMLSSLKKAKPKPSENGHVAYMSPAPHKHEPISRSSVGC